MTTGFSQRCVATVHIRPSSTWRAGSGRNRPRERNLRHTSPRWQSTAAKNNLLTNEPAVSYSKIEIPPECFTESSVVPEPSLDRSAGCPEADLSTTRPASIDSPAPLERKDYHDGNIPVGDRAKYFFRLGKSYLLFYKTGLKNVWTNWKRYRAIRQQFEGNSLNTIAKYGGKTIEGRKIPNISHSEYQLCQRTRHDVFKMVPFSLVFMICGEFTPLVIVALGSSVVPFTCRIPQQERKDVQKKLNHDKIYMEELPKVYPDVESPLESPDWQVEHLEAYRLGLTAIRKPIPILGPLYHSLLTRPRLARWCDNIVADTLLIHRQGGPSKLSHEEIYDWCDAYGLYALRKHVQKCRETGQDPKSRKVMSELLPKVDAEIKYMLDLMKDWPRLKPSEQWRIALRTVGSSSPDWQARVQDMRKSWKQG